MQIKFYPAKCPTHGLVFVPLEALGIPSNSEFSGLGFYDHIVSCPVPGCDEAANINTLVFNRAQKYAASIEGIGLHSETLYELYQFVKDADKKDLQEEEVIKQAKKIDPKAGGLFGLGEWSNKEKRKLLIESIRLLAAVTVAGAVLNVEAININSPTVTHNYGVSEAIEIESAAPHHSPRPQTRPDPKTEPEVDEAAEEKAKQRPHLKRKKRPGSPQRRRRTKPKR